MHIEILVEDASGGKLLESVLPKLLGEQGTSHTWRLHPYKGVGRIPKNLDVNADPAKRILLDRLPRILRGYGKTPSIDAVVIVLDSDQRNCTDFLAELKNLAAGCYSVPNTLFRLAVEEMEAWYLGDEQALRAAYPRARADVLSRYKQDSVCGTWELLADAVHPGGSAKIKKEGWPLSGQIKYEWASKIGPLLEPNSNNSPSFCKLCDGLRRLVARAN